MTHLPAVAAANPGACWTRVDVRGRLVLCVGWFFGAGMERVHRPGAYEYYHVPSATPIAIGEWVL